MHRICWDIEEAVSIVNLYYKYKNCTNCSSALKSELQELSYTLNKRADILNIHHDEKFRNLTGVKMIFHNVQYVDTNGKEGLSSASSIIYEAVNMYKKQL